MKTLICAFAILVGLVSGAATAWTFEGGVLSEPTGWQFSVTGGTLKKKAAGTATALDFSSLPEGCTITSFGSPLFQSASIVSIVLPEGLESIAGPCFQNCTKLTTIEPLLPATLTSIADNAFSGCRLLTGALALPNVTTLGKGAFSNCPVTGDLVLNDALTSVPANAFTSTKLTSVSFGAGSACVEICDSAFYNTSVTNVVLPRGLQTIGASAFGSCASLLAVEPFLPATVTSVGLEAFKLCGKLTGTLVLPPGLTSVEPGTFWSTSITGVSFAENSKCTAIGSGAFKLNSKLESFTFGNCPELASDAFGVTDYLCLFSLPRNVGWEERLGIPSYVSPGTDLYAKWKDLSSTVQGKWASVHKGDPGKPPKGGSALALGGSTAAPKFAWVSFLPAVGMAVLIK